MISKDSVICDAHAICFQGEANNKKGSGWRADGATFGAGGAMQSDEKLKNLEDVSLAASIGHLDLVVARIAANTFPKSTKLTFAKDMRTDRVLGKMTATSQQPITNIESTILILSLSSIMLNSICVYQYSHNLKKEVLLSKIINHITQLNKTILLLVLFDNRHLIGTGVSCENIGNTRKLSLTFFSLVLICTITVITLSLQPNYIAGALSQSLSYSNSIADVPSYTSSLAYSDSSIPDLFDKVKVSVVKVSPISESANNSLTGSGFVYDKNGDILTNSHVAGTASSVIVTFIDGNQYEATVVGKDPVNDIAVVKILGNHTQPIIPVQLGNSSTVRIGERVFAIGDPFGFSDTLTGGLISQVGRLLLESGSEAPYPHSDMIQTDASINPGNSGGPLVNLQGRVIGMNTATFNSQLGGATGLGFAVPSKTLLREAQAIIQNGTYPHPWLGMSGRGLDLELNRELGLGPNFRGVLVDSLVKGGPADKAGIHGSLHGDIIIALDGIPIKDTPDLLSYIENNKSPGESIIITIYRNNHTSNLNATLGQRPTSLYTSQYITSQTPLF